MKRIIFRTTDDTKDLTKFERKATPINNSNLRKNDPITENYEITKEVLGRGFQTFVYIGLNKISRIKSAIKVIEINSESLAEYEKEKSILKELEHPNIIHLIEVYETNFHYYFVMELCLGGNLNTLLKKCPDGRLLPSVSRLIISQLSQAILYCHERGICHRDIKLQNILLENEISDDISLNNNISIKLSSFRTSIRYKSKLPLTRPTGSLNIRAPEVFKNNYDEKCDIWSLGVVTYCLLSGRYPFECIEFPYHPQSRDISLITNIILHRLHFNQDCWAVIGPCAVEFIRGCLEYNPNNRFTALEVTEQSWLTGEKRKTHPLLHSLDVEGESEGDVITISRLNRSTRSLSKSFLRTSSRVSVMSTSTNTNTNSSPTSYPPLSAGSHHTITGSPMTPPDSSLQVAWDLQDTDAARSVPLLQQRHWDEDESALHENSIGYSRPPSPRPPFLAANSLTTFTSILKTKNIQLRKKLSQFFPVGITEDIVSSSSSNGNTSSGISKDQFVSLLSVIVPVEALDSAKDILLEAMEKDGGEGEGEGEYSLLAVLAVVVDQREIDMKQLNEALRLLDLEGKGYLTSGDLERVLIHIAEQKLLDRNTTIPTTTSTSTSTTTTTNNNNSRRNSLKIPTVEASDTTTTTIALSNTNSSATEPTPDSSLTSEKNSNPVSLSKLLGRLKLHRKHSNKSKRREKQNDPSSQRSLATTLSTSDHRGGEHGGEALNMDRLQKIILNLISQSDVSSTNFSYKDFIFVFMDAYNAEDRLQLPATTPPTSVRRHSFNNSNSTTVKKSLSFRHSLVTEAGDIDYTSDLLMGTAMTNGLYGGGSSSETKSACSRNNSFRFSPSLLMPPGQFGVSGNLPHVLDRIADDAESAYPSPRLSDEEDCDSNYDKEEVKQEVHIIDKYNSNNHGSGGRNNIHKKNATVRNHNANLKISETINSIAQSLVAACTFKATATGGGTGTGISSSHLPKKCLASKQRLTDATATSTQQTQQGLVVDCSPRNHSTSTYTPVPTYTLLDTKMQCYEVARRRSYPRPNAIIDNDNDTFDDTGTTVTAPVTYHPVPLTRSALRNRGYVPPLWETGSPPHPPPSVDDSYHTSLRKDKSSDVFRSSSSNETDNPRSEYYLRNKNEMDSNLSNASNDSDPSFPGGGTPRGTATISLHLGSATQKPLWNDSRHLTPASPHRRCHSDEFLSHLKNKNKSQPHPSQPFKNDKSPTSSHDTNNSSFHRKNKGRSLRKRATSWIRSELIGGQASEKRFSSIAPSSHFE